MPAGNNVIFRPKPGRFGVNAMATGAQIGTAVGFTVATSGTTSINVPVPNRKCQLISVNLSAKTAAAGSGAITAQVIKRNNQTGSPADVNITATKSLTSSVVSTADASYAIAISATDAQATFFPPAYKGAAYNGDTCRIDVVAAGTVTTQPQAVITCEWAVLE